MDAELNASKATPLPPDAIMKSNSGTEASAESAEVAFRSRELAIKEAELAVRERSAALTLQQAQRSPWRDPVILGIIAALIGFLSSVANAFFQGRSTAEAERMKFQSNLILEAIKTGDPAKAATNLSFFVQLGYIDDPRNRIQNFIEHRNETPVLPSPVSAPIPAKTFPPIRTLDPKSPERTAATPVGTIVALDKSPFCTAWLVANNLVLTADYCVKNMLPGDVSFRAGYLSTSAPGEIFKVKRIVNNHSNAGFALLETEGSPGTRFGVMKIADRKPLVGEPLLVVHHPDGLELSISGIAATCRVTAVSDVDFHHNCDTAGGSGGAPVLSRSDFVVLGIVYSGGPGGEVAKPISTAIMGATARPKTE